MKLHFITKENSLILLLILNSIHSLTLKTGNFQFITTSDETPQVLLAIEKVKEDCNKVLGFTPNISEEANGVEGIDIIILNFSTDKGKSFILNNNIRQLSDEWESHRIYSSPEENRIYLIGYDMRGTIYAVYTFSEKILGVPPLWYWSSWEFKKYSLIEIPDDFDENFKSPKVRYRAWFPNDADFFVPWQKDNVYRKEIWLETILRLKLNCVEVEGGVLWDGNIGLNDDCKRLKKYGLVMTSHHHTPLAGGFVHWEEFWKNAKKQSSVPQLTIENEEGINNIYTFYQHCIDSIKEEKMEYIWLIGFRGSGDHAWWEVGDKGIKIEGDPGDDKERAEIINYFTEKMYDMIKISLGENNPFVRMTFYNELSNLKSKGYLKPPTGENILWTYVAARRDHYPSLDLRQHNSNNTNVKVGLYMNFQFTSTGSHLAPAEGPWKMEYNFRFAMTKASLQFSVVNMGNLREHMFEASANAALLWDWNNYSTDNFLVKFCAMYYGKEYAKEIAQLYHDYYYSYWNQHESDFNNMPRQYIFQDLRYALAFSTIANNWANGNINIFDDEKFNIGNHDNELNELIDGIGKSAKSFTNVLYRADILNKKIESRYETFFNDNFLQYVRFMAGISQSLFHFACASKNSKDREGHGGAAIGLYIQGQRALFQSQHGEFSDWINNAEGEKFEISNKYKEIISKVKLEDCKFNNGTKINNNIYSYTEIPGTGTFDILIKYSGTTNKWMTVEINDKLFGDIYCPKTDETKSIKDLYGYLIITSTFHIGKNYIKISGNSLPILYGIHLIPSGINDESETKFEEIHPDENLDLSWNILDN